MAEQHKSDYLTTRELAELLRIKERKVYDLASSGVVPCSRATGKLLFPRRAIEAWIARNSGGLAPAEPGRRNAVVAGSHDPLLEWALRESRCGLATYFDGSLDGVARFAAAEAIAVGTHVYDPAADDWNRPLVAARFADQPVVLIEFAWRQRGLIVAAEQSRVRSVGDLAGARVVPRQPEAGSQRLLEHLIQAEGLDPAVVELAPVARTETDAALAVLEGKAEVAFGLLASARQFRLGFVPLVRERFDLLVDRRWWFEPPLQRLVAFWQSAAFRDKAAEMQGYDVSGIGTVHFNGP